MSFELRRANWDDLLMIYRWANDPAVRENSFSSDVIPLETHERWFRALLDDPNRRQYILLSDGVEVGQLRLSAQDDAVEISYSVAPEYRGRGFGKRLLALAADQARTDFPGAKYLAGKVKPQNAASRAAFESAGYQEFCVEYRLMI